MLTREHDEARQGESFSASSRYSVLGNTTLRKFYIESYGCAMNFSDSEVVASILQGAGFEATRDFTESDLILINTCSIREKAEQTIRSRLHIFRQAKRARPSMLIAVLGCMAERLKSKFLEEEKLVDLVIGPDSYRSLPALIELAEGGQPSVNVLLSRDETYADIAPVRLDSNGVNAFVSIMRGCNNMCTFCVVPFTRGRERSRNPDSILNECRDLFANGYREITLLGQNVDSYHWFSGVDGEKAVGFSELLEEVAGISPLLRIRFSTSHPKDITDAVLHIIAKHSNICNYIHLPVQSGSTRVLQRMNRTYTREWYLAKVKRIREIIPDCGISSDIIAGFCGETEADHQDTISLMKDSAFDFSYMYFYSERPGTLASKRYADDIPEPEKKRRLEEIIKLQRKLSEESNRRDIGTISRVLIEGDSKKSTSEWMGRNDQNKVVVFPKEQAHLKKGDYVYLKIVQSTGGTLIGAGI